MMLRRWEKEREGMTLISGNAESVLLVLDVEPWLLPCDCVGVARDSWNVHGTTYGNYDLAPRDAESLAAHHAT